MISWFPSVWIYFRVLETNSYITTVYQVLIISVGLFGIQICSWLLHPPGFEILASRQKQLIPFKYPLSGVKTTQVTESAGNENLDVCPGLPVAEVGLKADGSDREVHALFFIMLHPLSQHF